MTKKRWNNYTLNLAFLIKSILGHLAYYTIYPFWMTAFLHKLRGVKIEDCGSVFISVNVLIDSLYPEKVKIDKGAYITRGCKILTHFNPTDGIAAIWGVDSIVKPVSIGEEAFLGVNAIILPGVNIGKYAIVAAGSVVTKSVPDYAVVAGNPAKVIGDVRKGEGKPFS